MLTIPIIFYCNYSICKLWLLQHLCSQLLWHVIIVSNTPCLLLIRNLNGRKLKFALTPTVVLPTCGHSVYFWREVNIDRGRLNENLSVIIYNLQVTISNVVQLFKTSVDSIYSNHIYDSNVAIANGRTTHNLCLRVIATVIITIKKRDKIL